MAQVKKLDFSGTTIYCGVDVHKKSWRVNIQDKEFELEDFTQNPDAVLLHRHLTNRYPGAAYKIGYEAGFSGFSMQRGLSQRGCECWVVNAADIPRLPPVCVCLSTFLIEDRNTIYVHLLYPVSAFYLYQKWECLLHLSPSTGSLVAIKFAAC